MSVGKGSAARTTLGEGTVAGGELEPGTRVELIDPAGDRERGEQGVVAHACTAIALVRFDDADPYGAREEVLNRGSPAPRRRSVRARLTTGTNESGRAGRECSPRAQRHPPRG
jgi:hypothetical protein